MPLRRRHVLHVGVIIAVLLQLGFAVAFLLDASTTNRTYDALAVHKVAVKAHTIGCAAVGRFARSGAYGIICKVGYDYRNEQFTAYIPLHQDKTFYLDPSDTSRRMSKVSFDKGPEETAGDIVIATLLLTGAVLVTAIHQIHTHKPFRSRRSTHTPHTHPT